MCDFCGCWVYGVIGHVPAGANPSDIRRYLFEEPYAECCGCKRRWPAPELTERVRSALDAGVQSALEVAGYFAPAAVTLPPIGWLDDILDSLLAETRRREAQEP